MENFKKLNRDELKKVTGGTIGHKVHCIDDQGFEHLLEADTCPNGPDACLTYCRFYEPPSLNITSAYCV